MGFIVILILTTLSIAGSAAFFSIYGLAQIFAGSFWPVVIMATSLEAGKLVSASYVYRFWSDISFFMKTYLITAIIILMLITSAGIFGFLSAAYQTDTLSLREVESQIVLLEEEKGELRERKKQIDDNIASINPNYITKRMELIDKLSPETNRINNRIPTITSEIHKLKSIKIVEESHVGPIIYIAQAFNQNTDDATKWMILLIIFAFDPLAVALTIAANNALLHRRPIVPKLNIKRKETIIPDPYEVEKIEFSEEDLIEPIDDLNLEMGEPDNLITEIQSLFPNYREGDAEKSLAELLEKKNRGTLTEHEQKQYNKIMKMLQAARLANLHN